MRKNPYYAEFLSSFGRGVVNLHTGWLPFNRGAHPNVWSIVKQKPAGVTLHWMDTRVDTGDIIARKQVEVSAEDTGKSLYHKLETAALALLEQTWPTIEAGRAPRERQSGVSTSHRVRDLELIDEIELDRSYSARYLIDILRARTFPPYRGAFFRADGKRTTPAGPAGSIQPRWPRRLPKPGRPTRPSPSRSSIWRRIWATSPAACR